MNIRSLNANNVQLALLLNSLAINFQIICLSEIWSTNIQFLTNCLPNYKFQYQTCSESRGGGVGIFYNNSFSIKLQNELQIQGDDLKTENLWLELTIDKKEVYTIGVIYRHPHGNLTKFNDIFSNTLQQIQNRNDIKTCIITGDFNIDLLKYHENYPTQMFLDNLNASSFIPTIQLPTRITHQSASLIDNILVHKKRGKINLKKLGQATFIQT